MNEVLVSAQELQILLNLIDEISMAYPFYKHFDLLTAEQEENGYKIRILQGIADFDEQQSHFSSDEMPSYNDFLFCLLSSGITHYENLNTFKERMKAYKNLGKTVLFSPDTNILYHCFLTNSEIDLRKVLIIETVKEEIEAVLNFKYSPQQISELKKETKYQNFLLDEFLNRRMKKSRIACIALKEYRELRKFAVEIESIEPSTNDKERNDLIIVKTLRKFEKERLAMPVLLTSDRQISDLCDAEGLEHFLFTLPHAVDANFCSFSSMVKLIYNLAMTFGVIRINSIVIFGEFKGKNAIEELKLRFLDDELWKGFEKHLRICRRLLSLGIE
ncbi:MAG: PIN domain-containing protein [Archaeoglobaceae archaeon]|nr:PIN domain-containing protein [Archaeoglobaceae archaeon]MDW8128845.1 PIN domain-containing protein [Archaeoglobaceae archaeon]